MTKFLHALSQMTISPNVCHGGAKINIVPSQAHVDIDIRTLPNQDDQYVLNQLRKALKPMLDQVEITPVPVSEGGGTNYGSASEPESAFVILMEQIVKELKGSAFNLVPMVSPAATDCRFFRREFGTQAYGFSLFDDKHSMGELIGFIHGDDERVSLGTLDLTSQAYMELAKRFLT